MRYLAALLLFVSCVPLKEYRSRQAELAELNLQNRTLRKEIRVLEAEERELKDSIEKRNVRNEKLALEIKNRLEQNSIRINVNSKTVNALDIRQPDTDPEFYNRMWSRNTSRDTNSASKISWLSKSEKEIYYWLNFARLNPRRFCELYVLPKLRYDSQNIYILSLIDYMYSMKPRNALMPEKMLYESAKCHAESSGKLNYIGHQRQNENCKSRFSGECCSYGLNNPLQVVLQLLVDDGIPSLGHRYICLGWYQYLGVSMAPHKGFGTNVVLDFD